MDFTLDIYRSLLIALNSRGYEFRGFEAFNAEETGRIVVLRHDVDRLPQNALKMARIEKELSAKASYHFRTGKSGFDRLVIKEIADMGHEIGYHYEDLSHAARKLSKRAKSGNKLFEKAYSMFADNLRSLKAIYPVRVISMHGSPLSIYDNRKLWKYYSYREFGVVCEPYFDINLSKVLYLTDTGRRWNSDRANLRDRAFPGADGFHAGKAFYDGWCVKPAEGSAMNMTQHAKALQASYKFSSTETLIRNIYLGTIPDKIIISTHPQRWNNGGLPWLKELVMQNIKNSLKVVLSLSRAKLWGE
ncbi:MAG TPA: hypothetical protein PKH02_00055 [Bacteroidales bacterium]|nr:hypothetical protein [Bacteroidales bacterium]HPT11006.1 hypothetical protein [Bacteroidales bacterium]